MLLESGLKEVKNVRKQQKIGRQWLKSCEWFMPHRLAATRTAYEEKSSLSKISSLSSKPAPLWTEGARHRFYSHGTRCVMETTFKVARLGESVLEYAKTEKNTPSHPTQTNSSLDSRLCASFTLDSDA